MSKMSAWMLVLVTVLAEPMAACGQSASSNGNASGQAAVALLHDVRGRVFNGLDGSPIARALVSLNQRSVLTDAEGRFSIPQFNGDTGSVTVMRPGFVSANVQRVTNLDAALEFRIFPEALITGTVSDRAGAPLTRQMVQIRRWMGGTSGPRWQMLGAVQTDSHGGFRFRQPAGRYQVLTGVGGKVVETGELLLPVTYPEHDASGTGSYFQLLPNAQRQVDLRVRVAAPTKVVVRVDPDDARRGAQFYALTSSGESFTVQPEGRSAEGQVVLAMPEGTYALHARVQDRDDVLEGSARVSVTPQGAETTIHLEPAASLPVELSVDSAVLAQAANGSALHPPAVAQFNLRLRRTDAEVAPFGQEEVGLHPRENMNFGFKVTPGRYRLEANGGGGWYIAAAYYGVTDLVTSEVVIGGGGGSGTAIRLIVSNVTGQVNGTVKADGSGELKWVYLVPKLRSLIALNPLAVSSSASGLYTFSARIAVGTYSAFAVDQQIDDDLRDPEVLAKYSAGLKAVEVKVDAAATVELETTREKSE